MGRTSPFLSSYRLRFLTHRISNEKTTFKGMSTRIDEEILPEPETLTEPCINGHKIPILARNWSALQGWKGGAHWGTGLSPSSWFNREIDRVRGRISGKALPSCQTDELQNNHWLVRLRRSTEAGRRKGQGRQGYGCDSLPSSLADSSGLILIFASCSRLLLKDQGFSSGRGRKGDCGLWLSPGSFLWSLPVWGP